MRLAALPLAVLWLSCVVFASTEATPKRGLLLADSEVPEQSFHIAGRALGARTTSQDVQQVVKRHGDHGHEEAQEESSSDGHEHMHAPESKPPVVEDEHAHHHSHAPPLLTLNETDILRTHAPTPPSYFDLDASGEGQPGLLFAHIAFMSIAFFVLLPLAIFLKAGASQLALLPQAGFVMSSVFGTFFGTLYRSLTPERYPHNAHIRIGWITMVLVAALNAWDVIQFGVKVQKWIKGKRTSATFAHDEEEAERLVDKEHELHRVESPTEIHSPASDTTQVNWIEVELTRNGNGRGSSMSSDDTLYDSAAHDRSRPVSVRKRSAYALETVLHLLQSSLVVLAYVETLTGIITYSGTCRQNYLNGCLAHLIKGSIFMWYGLLTFARFVGAFSSLGWAWNRRASPNGYSAEFVESAVIFAYGASNTWLERLGKTGAYSVKDIQHISIAVMFWFAGGLGMLLESRKVRSWLSQTAVLASGRPASDVREPASASFSFNPFPALVIGVTGVAMAAHHQTYQFQVEIHALWGQLLAGFALFRFLTYFFLYLRPPASLLPSRPPTEALASFCLTCGGVVFMLSTEEVTFAALRNGWDDMMAFLNATVALVCIWFTWCLILFAVKGWALSRSTPPAHDKQHYHRSASMQLDRAEESTAA